MLHDLLLARPSVFSNVLLEIPNFSYQDCVAHVTKSGRPCLFAFCFVFGLHSLDCRGIFENRGRLIGRRVFQGERTYQEPLRPHRLHTHRNRQTQRYRSPGMADQHPQSHLRPHDQPDQRTIALEMGPRPTKRQLNRPRRSEHSKT